MNKITNNLREKINKKKSFVIHKNLSLANDHKFNILTFQKKKIQKIW